MVVFKLHKTVKKMRSCYNMDSPTVASSIILGSCTVLPHRQNNYCKLLNNFITLLLTVGQQDLLEDGRSGSK